MAEYAKFSTNFDTFDTFTKFKDELNNDIIKNSLDETLLSSVATLKENLKFLINEKIQNKPEQQVSTDRPAVSATELNQDKTTIPKADAELLKTITKGKVDLTKLGKNKDYTTPQETNLVFGAKNKYGDTSNRVTLRQEITSDQTVDSQFSKAVEFFNKTMFALPDNSGKIQYYANPGIDLTSYIKIKCSTQTGADNSKPKKGLSPAERFQRDSSNKIDETGKHFSEWTLKQEAIPQIKNSFINLTPVIDAAKNGEFEKAVTLAKLQDKNGKLPEVVQQTAQLPDGPEVPQSTKNYTNILTLINNLEQNKKVTSDQVVYSLISDYNIDTENKSYFNEIKAAIQNWVVENEEQWFNYFVKSVETLIKKYES